MIARVTYYTVECRCGRQHEESVTFWKDTIENAMAAAREDGWQATVGEQHLCPACLRSQSNDFEGF